MSGLTVFVQMDAPHRLDPRTDSTLLLMQEAARLGHKVYHYTPDRLACENGEVFAIVQPFPEGAPRRADLREADVVLMRQDPPFDMAYVTACLLLERVHPKPLVVNDPAFVRSHPEKLLPLEFPEFIPPTLISADRDSIRAFHAAQGEIVLKPLYSYGGRGVFHINRAGDNLDALLEQLTLSGVPLVAQRFLPEVSKGETRITLIAGTIAGQFFRIPAAGDIRSNRHAGGTQTKAELTEAQRRLAETVGAALLKKGVFFAGIDLVGDRLLEINITSPGGLDVLRAFYGLTPERDFWEAVEARLSR